MSANWADKLQRAHDARLLGQALRQRQSAATTAIVIDALGIRDGRVSAPLRGPAPSVGDHVIARDHCNELRAAYVEAVGPNHVRLVLL